MPTSYLSSTKGSVSLGLTILQQHDVLMAAFLAQGWRMKPDTPNEFRSVTNPYFDVMPPISESVGNSNGYQFLRVFSTGTIVAFQPMVRYVVALPQTYSIWDKTGGAVTCSVTINGVTVSYTGAAGDTAKANLWGLYCALRDSVDANFTAFDYFYDPMPTQRADDPYDFIILKQKVPAANSTITVNANINGAANGSYQAAGTEMARQGSNVVNMKTIPVDLVSGWDYYLSASKRGVTLASRIGTGPQTAICAGFRNHADALTAIPSPGLIPWPLIPQEIFTTSMPIYAANGDSDVMVCPGLAYGRATAPATWPNIGCKDANGHRARNCWVNDMVTFSNVGGAGLISVRAGSPLPVFSTMDPTLTPANTYTSRIEDDYAVWKPLQAVPFGDTVYGGSQYDTSYLPAGDVGDVWRFLGTTASENSIVVADPEGIPTTLTTAINATATPATIDVGDTSNLLATGYVVIGAGEIFHYTSKNATQLTGTITRENFKVPSKVRHFVGEEVRQARFFVIINGAALDWGYDVPV